MEDLDVSKLSLKKQAFLRFSKAHPRYHGGFLVDCFFDEAKYAFKCYDPMIYSEDDPRWNLVCKQEN